MALVTDVFTDAGVIPELLAGLVVVTLAAAWLIRHPLDLSAVGLRSRRSERVAGRRREGRARRVGIVVHGMKVLAQDARRQEIELATREAGWAAPVWFETTSADPGGGQAHSALEAKMDAVLAFGGDGTVRAVAEVLCNTTTPLGLLPAGTGNLLARNLGIPTNRLSAAVKVGLTGNERRIDVGRVELDLSGHDEPPSDQTFLVMAGFGFDAEVMAAVDARLKQRIGWFAYVVAGLRRMKGRRISVTLRVDDQPPEQRRVRAVIIGNCGMLTAGIPLIPDALVDDGTLNVVVVSPRSVLGWLAVSATVITRTGHPAIEHLRCRSVEISADRPGHVQLDGDYAGRARVLRAHVDHLALRVRVP